MNTSRALSANASLMHLVVSSKHNAKYRRVPRIISRRLYRYRRKSLLAGTKRHFQNWSQTQNNEEFSSGISNSSKLDQTVSRFSKKYHTRSYSADSDPSIMNTSAHFNCGLITRRYSSPEIAMRKHKLQDTSSSNITETASGLQPFEANLITAKKPPNCTTIKDESCQTEAPYEYANFFKGQNSYKKPTKIRRRSNLKSLKKANSYCQYRSISMSHKKSAAGNKMRETRSLNDIVENRANEAGINIESEILSPNENGTEIRNDAIALTDLSPSNSRASVDIRRFAPELVVPTFVNDNAIIRRRSTPSGGTTSNQKLKSTIENSSPTDDTKFKESNGGDLKVKIPNVGFDPNRRRSTPDKSVRSLDQTTSGYNTLSGSPDDTPRRKSPADASDASLNRGRKSENTEERIFPITFHSESVFLHPYENGRYLSRREFHHVSINLEPADRVCARNSETSSSKKDYFKTEIELKVNDKFESNVGEELIENDDDDHRVQNQQVRLTIESGGGDSKTFQKFNKNTETKELLQTEITVARRQSKLVPKINSENNDNEYDDDYANDDRSKSTNYKIDVENDNIDLSDSGFYLPSIRRPTNNYYDHRRQQRSSKSITNIDFENINLDDNLRNNVLLLEERRKIADPLLVNETTTATTNKITYDDNDDEAKLLNERKNSKIALNYLFQKLGNSYPKRCSLKQSNCNESANPFRRGGTYLSQSSPELGPPLSSSNAVTFNNRTYEILSNNLLPNERTATTAAGETKRTRISTSSAAETKTKTPPPTNDSNLAAGEILSDGDDISIPDSLEDFQHNTKLVAKHNEYEKYDDRLARGDVRAAAAVSKSAIKERRNKVENGVSYFIPLFDTTTTTNSTTAAITKTYTMPIKLKEKLYNRNKNISKHCSCVEFRKVGVLLPKKPRTMVHKQIQTCLNIENSLERRYRKLANGTAGVVPRRRKEKSSKEMVVAVEGERSADLDLDAKITNILLNGLRRQHEQEDYSGSRVRNGRPRNRDTISSSEGPADTLCTNRNGNGTPCAVISENVEPPPSEMSTPIIANYDNNDSNNNNRYNGEEFPDKINRRESVIRDNETNNSYECLPANDEQIVGETNNDANSNCKTYGKSGRICPIKINNNKNRKYANGDNRPTEFHDFRRNQAATTACFSKNAAKKSKDFKEPRQARRQNVVGKISNRRDSSSLNLNCNDNGNSNKLNENYLMLPVLYTKPTTKMSGRKERNNVKYKNHISRISGARARRFYQKFEAIPEELSNTSCESVEQNRENDGKVTRYESEGGDNETGRGENVIEIEKKVVENGEKTSTTTDRSNEEIRNNINARINDDTDIVACNNVRNYETAAVVECRDKLKSQKGRDSLSIGNEQDELITISKGWINFYLLRGNSNEEGSAVEENADENVTLTETVRIPQQYTVHVHATPEINAENKLISPLPDLHKSSRRQIDDLKVKQNQQTSLPDIENITACYNRNSKNRVSKNYRLKNDLPKLRLSGEESDISSKKGTDDNFELKDKPIGLSANLDDTIQSENSLATTTSSNNSESSIKITSKIKNYNKKSQRRRHFGRYQPTQNNDKWSVTFEGSHREKLTSIPSKIEMKLGLSIKENVSHNDVSPNHSWKFTFRSKNASEELCRADQKRTVSKNSLPSYLNFRYKMLPFPVLQNENIKASDIDNSRSDSTLSSSGRSYVKKMNTDNSCPKNFKRLNDSRHRVQTSDDDLTVKGLAINPQRKPRVLTMSERDIRTHDFIS